jgi:hypothetical protein
MHEKWFWTHDKSRTPPRPGHAMTSCPGTKLVKEHTSSAYTRAFCWTFLTDFKRFVDWIDFRKQCVTKPTPRSKHFQLGISTNLTLPDVIHPPPVSPCSSISDQHEVYYGTQNLYDRAAYPRTGVTKTLGCWYNSWDRASIRLGRLRYTAVHISHVDDIHGAKVPTNLKPETLTCTTMV